VLAPRLLWSHAARSVPALLIISILVNIGMVRALRDRRSVTANLPAISWVLYRPTIIEVGRSSCFGLFFAKLSAVHRCADDRHVEIRRVRTPASGEASHG
jgi:hypothetical protein